MAAGAIGTQDGHAERLRLHRSTTHTLLLHSGSLQRVHGLTVTLALKEINRQTEGRVRVRQKDWRHVKSVAISLPEVNSVEKLGMFVFVIPYLTVSQLNSLL